MRFSIRWDGDWQGYRVSVPNLSPIGEPVEVVTADEADRWRAALEILADQSNWSEDPHLQDAWLHGHFTPYELAVEALKPTPESNQRQG